MAYVVRDVEPVELRLVYASFSPFNFVVIGESWLGIK
jgi:hypothetical protein